MRDLLKGGASSLHASCSASGWIRSVRRQKRFSFLELNDGSSAVNLQVVWPESDAAHPLPFAEAEGALLSTGASVHVEGVLLPSPKAGQSVELAARSIRVVGACDASYPLQKKAHSAEFLREILHLRARGSQGASVLRLRHTLACALHAHLQAAGLVQVHTPVLTGNDCEGAGEQFLVSPTSWPAASPPFFGRPAYLTVSGQLHLEAAAQGLSRVYAFGPTFRAENSNTSRHLAEFWMLEPELAPGDLQAAMQLCQGALQACCAAALGPAGAADTAALGSAASGGAPALLARLQAAAQAPAFPTLTYTQALRLLNAAPTGLPQLAWGADLPSEHERWLCEQHTGGPVFVTHYPAALKPFYMRQAPAGGAGGAGALGPVVENFDLLVPGVGELAGGSAREDRLAVLGASMAARGLLSPAFAQAVAALAAEGGGRQGSSSLQVGVADPANGTLDWYLDLRRYGGMPSAGWGMGFERLVAWAAGLDNVRDAIPCPRARHACSM